jgi:ribosomal protein L29
MKVKDLRIKPEQELKKDLKECYKKCMQLRFAIAAKEGVKPNAIKQARRDVAKVKTVLREKFNEETK